MSSPSRQTNELPLDVPPERRPAHIAIIMDGNGRWAQQQDLPRIEGHLRGVETVRRTMEACKKYGIQVLTLYCLSSENWKRPPQELEFLMTLLQEYLIAERGSLVENNLQFKIIGRREGLAPEVQMEMDRTLEACQSNDGMTLCLAINYGSRCELVDAVQAISSQVSSGALEIDEITEELVGNNLYTSGLPDPDLLIRTSGEMRISNFLLWQISYAEIWVTETPWPEFDEAHLVEAIRQYAGRDRRFGGLKHTDKKQGVNQ